METNVTALPSFRRNPEERAAEKALNDFQSHTAEVIGAESTAFANSVVWVLFAMVALCLAVGSIVRLDRVVESHGMIVSQARQMVVQPLENAIIRSIDVREGEMVKKGQTLAMLDPTMTAADVAQLERQAASLSAEVARLQAERDNVLFTSKSTDPYIQLQMSIARHRRAEFNAKLANYDQKLETAEATVVRSQDDATHYRARLGLLSEVEKMRTTLERNQTGSRLNSLLASDTRVEAARNLTSSEGARRAAQHEMEALRSERESFIEQWRSATMQELVNRTVELGRVKEELAKASKRRDLVELRAVDDAVVLQLAKVSVGSVVTAAQTLVTLVPSDAPLEVEVDIAAMDQGFISVGNEVAVKLDAYPYVRHGIVKGTVRMISEDSFAVQEGSSAIAASPRYYKARITLNDLSLRDVPADFRLIPGMTAKADIMVGSRTILSYLFDRVLELGSEGMREP